MTRHIRWQILLIFVGLLLVGILLTYLAFNYTTVLRPGQGGTYVEGIVGIPRTLNPLLAKTQVERDLCSLIFNGLTRLNADGEVEGQLAREWEATIDGLSYTFHLRSNAFWHDGTPVTADDVIFTISLIQDPRFPGSPTLHSLWSTVEVEKVDRRTVAFTLSEPYAPFLDYTTFGILPEHLLEGVDAADLPLTPFNMSPIGSGPFVFEELRGEEGVIESAILSQNSRYYEGRTYIERIQFRFYPDYESLMTAYSEGEVEGLAEVPTGDLDTARAFPELDLYSAPIAEYDTVLLNLDDPGLPFFQEPEVRQALMYGMDRERIIQDVLSGQAIVAHSPILPGTWAHSDEIAKYEHDVEEARELLDEIGWTYVGPEGVRGQDGSFLEFELLTWDDPQRLAMAEALASQWSMVGVEATVRGVSVDELHSALVGRDFDAALVRMSVPGDPDPYPFWHQEQIDDGQNYAGLDHRRISELTELARITLRRERRKSLYAEFQQIFTEEVPALPLTIPIYTYGVDERVHDVQIGPLARPSDRFKTISDWWIVPKRVFVSDEEARLP